MCAYRHVLVPGRVTLSWLLCSCPASGEQAGHVVYRCLECMDEGRGSEAELLPAEHRAEFTATRMPWGTG